jgi:hypothetical protein
MLLVALLGWLEREQHHVIAFLREENRTLKAQLGNRRLWLNDDPRWTAENRQFVDRAKPAISRTAETSEFYFVPWSVHKSVCTFVRQLRGPHLSTWA